MPRPLLVATDLDGTLLRDDGTLSARTLDALRVTAGAGAEVVLVTARPPRYLDALAAATGLTATAVCSNGAIVYDIGSRTVTGSTPLAVPVARSVAAALRDAAPSVGFAVETGRHLHWAPGYGHHLPEDADAELPVRSLADLWTTPDPAVKLLAWSPALDADTLLAVAERAAGGRAQFTHSGGRGLLEVSARGVTKAAALAALCADRGIPAERVVAFGDMPNDLPVLTWAGTAYAVANAHPAVLAAVPHRTASNEDDGVARVLERLFGAGAREH
ncbi:HAD hydrolase family protein [Actinacidiphila glaucinigra]|uniref:HAD family hydrolase n=1 Tax=Actinacidiphila glaucinigra TaxID=235986 RepID=UPI0033AD33E9